MSILLHPIPTYLHFIPIEPPGLGLRLRLRRFSSSKRRATTSATSTAPLKKPNTLSCSFARYGFSVTQTDKIMSKDPWFLSPEPEKAIEPKLEYFLAYGFPRERLIQLICYDPNILCASLASRIIPNLNLLEQLLGSKTLVFKACDRGPWLLRNDLEKTLMPIVKELKAFGVPDYRIVQLSVSNPLALSYPVSNIREGLNKLKGMGMKPDTTTFITGLTSMVSTKKETWERKMQLYMSFGWSEEDVLMAFARQPTCMMLSDDKIKRMMGFFTNKLSWDPAIIVKRVSLLTVSLENRIIPRCAVMEVLRKKGLWNGKPSMYTLLCISEKQFEERFVENYKEKIPGLCDAFIGRTKFSGS
jgi:mTERF domain-containing protein, mitochondrial